MIKVFIKIYTDEDERKGQHRHEEVKRTHDNNGRQRNNYRNHNHNRGHHNNHACSRNLRNEYPKDDQFYSYDGDGNRGYQEQRHSNNRHYDHNSYEKQELKKQKIAKEKAILAAKRELERKQVENDINNTVNFIVDLFTQLIGEEEKVQKPVNKTEKTADACTNKTPDPDTKVERKDTETLNKTLFSVFGKHASKDDLDKISKALQGQPVHEKETVEKEQLFHSISGNTTEKVPDQDNEFTVISLEDLLRKMKMI